MSASLPQFARRLAPLAVAVGLGSPAVAETGEAARATALVAIHVVAGSSATVIEIRTDGEVSHVDRVEIAEPRRLVLDFPGLTSRLDTHHVAVESDAVTGIRVGLHAEKSRVVIDLGPGAESTRVSPRDRGLSVRVGHSVPAGATAQQAAEPAETNTAIPSANPTGGGVPPRRAPVVHRWIDEHGITHYTTDPERIPHGSRADPAPAMR